MPSPILTVSLSATSAELADAIARRIAPAEALTQAAARGVSNLVVDHLRARDATSAHREGFPRSGYWAKAAQSVSTSASGNTATVTIYAPGIRLRRYGGTVRPRSGKSLAIPARAEVADIWPREYAQRERAGLFLYWPKGRKSGMLARRERTGHLTALWWLVGATHHKADETVLPRESELERAALDAALDALDAYKSGGRA